MEDFKNRAFKTGMELIELDITPEEYDRITAEHSQIQHEIMQKLAELEALKRSLTVLQEKSMEDHKILTTLKKSISCKVYRVKENDLVHIFDSNGTLLKVENLKKGKFQDSLFNQQF